jgi:uncharacterized membrane protein YfcA
VGHYYCSGTIFFVSKRWSFSAKCHADCYSDFTGNCCAYFTKLNQVSLSKDNVDFNLLKTWGGYILIGFVTGSVLVTEYGGQWLTVLLGMVAILSALNMLFRTKKTSVSTSLPRKWV